MAIEGLDPNIAKFLDGPKPSSSPPAATTTGPTAAAAPATSDDALMPPQWLHDRAIALSGGLATGAASVANAIPAWFGAKPWVPTQRDPATGNVLPAAIDPQTVRTMQDYPTTASIGQIGGQIVGTLPALIGTEAAIPALAGLGAAGRVASSALTNPLLRGAVTGAEQNLLTAGEAPDESLWRRAGFGAATGAAFAGAGSKLASWFGAGAPGITPAVQDAAQTAQKAGIDVGIGNLPRVGATATSQGAAATVPQAQQATQAFTKLLGQPNTTDLAPASLTGMLGNLGQNVGNAAAAGKIAYNRIEPELTRIESDYANSPVYPQIKRLLNNVLNQVGSNGEIAGSDFQNLIQHNSILDAATRSARPELAEPAQEIETALANGFRQSSPQGVADAFSDARGKYKLGLALESNVKTSGVNGQTLLNPGTIYDTLKTTRFVPDIARLGAGNTTFDQAANLSRSMETLFGGAGGAAGGAGPGWSGAKFGLGAAGAVGGAGAAWQALTNPGAVGALSAWTLAHPITAGLLAAGAGAQGLRTLGHAFQGSQPFVNRLISQGAPWANRVAPWTGAYGTTALPTPRQGQ